MVLTKTASSSYKQFQTLPFSYGLVDDNEFCNSMITGGPVYGTLIEEDVDRASTKVDIGGLEWSLGTLPQ